MALHPQWAPERQFCIQPLEGMLPRPSSSQEPMSWSWKRAVSITPGGHIPSWLSSHAPAHWAWKNCLVGRFWWTYSKLAKKPCIYIVGPKNNPMGHLWPTPLALVSSCASISRLEKYSKGHLWQTYPQANQAAPCLCPGPTKQPHGLAPAETPTGQLSSSTAVPQARKTALYPLLADTTLGQLRNCAATSWPWETALWANSKKQASKPVK